FMAITETSVENKERALRPNRGNPSELLITAIGCIAESAGHVYTVQGRIRVSWDCRPTAEPVRSRTLQLSAQTQSSEHRSPNVGGYVLLTLILNTYIAGQPRPASL